MSKTKTIQQEEVERLEGVLARREAKVHDAKRKLAAAKERAK